MNILVVGAGYVGLVTAACLANRTNRVVCVDTDPKKLAKLAAGQIPIYEPGLKEIVDAAMASGQLSFELGIKAGLSQIEQDGAEPTLVFIAVGTPQGEDGSADLRYVLAAAREIGQHLTKPAIVINNSTVPVGTADSVKGEVAWQLFQRKCFIDFDVASNPEFLKEGAAIEDFFKPDRIVIGSDNEQTRHHMLRLYRPFVDDDKRLLTVGVKEAELIKYASNAMQATRISFMNEIANICDRYGIDVEDVRQGVGMDSRIGPAFLKAGCGYGVESRNKKQKQYLFEQIVTRFGKDLTGRKIAVWGLAFKPETDDMREASSIDLIRALCHAGAHVVAHDPVAKEVAEQIFADLIRHHRLTIVDQASDATQDADALALVTEWAEYKKADFALVKARLKSAVVFDGRNHLDPVAMKTLGFHYAGVGRV